MVSVLGNVYAKQQLLAFDDKLWYPFLPLFTLIIRCRPSQGNTIRGTERFFSIKLIELQNQLL